MRRLLLLFSLAVTLTVAAILPATASPLAAPCTPGAIYNSTCDVDQNGAINITDIQLTAGHWNQNGQFTSGGWDLAGNAGTNPATNFLGTTDGAALELRANNWRVLRLEPNGSRPNVIGGSFANAASAGVESATVAGGGSESVPNRVTDSYGFVGGGYGNTAGDNAGTVNDRAFGTVGGGGGNSASGWKSTIGGGWYNVASGEQSVVGGGQVNESTGLGSFIGGGFSNVVNGIYGAVAGGDDNQVAGQRGFVGGGEGNWASGHAVVAGGLSNTANPYGTVPGGVDNFAAGDYSFAAGRRAQAYYDGDFVWADSTDADFGATATDQFLVRASGGVGLGTNAPSNQLHVAESLDLSASPANHVAQIQNTSTGNSADVLALKIGYTSNPVSSNNYITFFKGDNSSVGSIEGNSSGGVVLSGPGTQIALWMPKLHPSEAMAPGDLIGVVDGRATKNTTGASRVLVVAGNAMLAGADPGQEGRAGYVLITVLGLAEVRVAGPVRAGDIVLPSGRNDGTGMAAAPEALLSTQVAQMAGAVWSDQAEEDLGWATIAIGIGGVDATIQRLLTEQHQQNVRIADLETRLDALEQAASVGP